VVGVGQAVRVAKLRARHTQSPRLAIHHLCEVFFVAGNGFGQGDTGVISRLNDHTLEQIVDFDLGPHLDKHPGTAGLPCLARNQHFLVELEGSLLECRESQVSRHQFGQRRRFEALVWRLGGKLLARSHLDQQP